VVKIGTLWFSGARIPWFLLNILLYEYNKLKVTENLYYIVYILHLMTENNTNNSFSFISYEFKEYLRANGYLSTILLNNNNPNAIQRYSKSFNFYNTLITENFNINIKKFLENPDYDPTFFDLFVFFGNQLIVTGVNLSKYKLEYFGFINLKTKLFLLKIDLPYYNHKVYLNFLI
jgi:hypothetical protein